MSTEKKVKPNLYTERQLESERKEYKEMLQRARDEAKDLESKNGTLQSMRIAIYESLLVERLDLLHRIARIDQRCKVLDLPEADRLVHYNMTHARWEKSI